MLSIMWLFRWAAWWKTNSHWLHWCETRKIQPFNPFPLNLHWLSCNLRLEQEYGWKIQFSLHGWAQCDMMGLLRPVVSKSESQNVNWDLRRPDETSDRKCCWRGERVKASSPHVRIFLKCLLRISLKCLLRIFLACWEYFSNEKIFMTFHWTTFGWRPGNRPPLDLKKGFCPIYQLWAGLRCSKWPISCDSHLLFWCRQETTVGEGKLIIWVNF